jgi:uncharacterized protein YjbI with pentapeptide repeats
LECVNLFRSYLIGADLIGSNLYHANAIGAIFREARFLYGGEHNIFICADFRGASIAHDAICRGMNVIWDTIMPDGSIERGPYFGEWKSITK